MEQSYKGFLELSPEEFDQDEEKGWRRLDNAGQMLEAIEAIRLYIATNKQKMQSGSADDRELMSLMYFHAGQLTALHDTDHYAEAINWFRQADMTNNQRWNYYVAATIAFLESNRETLAVSLESLKQVEEPSKRNLSEVVTKLLRTLDSRETSYDKAIN